MKEVSDILIHPLTTEKSVRLMEARNEIVFVVSENSTKKQIKKAFEKLFKVKVVKINTINDVKGRKKAFIRLHKDYPATDVGTRLGLM